MNALESLISSDVAVEAIDRAATRIVGAMGCLITVVAAVGGTLIWLLW